MPAGTSARDKFQFRNFTDRTLIGEGRSINVTLIFSLERYAEVIRKGNITAQ